MTIRIFKKDKNKSEPKKRFDPRTGEETNKPGGKDPRNIYTPMKRGGLKGKQKKLDKNNNGRIDAEDFKLMKASTGKSVRGYGAARTSGSGLMDEQMAPGKVMNAKRGKFTKFTKVFETAAKAGDKGKGTSTIVGVKPNVQKQVFQAKKKKYSSMEEMRKAKGFRPGETAESFNKRRLKIAAAKTASKAGTIGKIALGVVAAGIGAKKYLESKMKKKKEAARELEGDVKGSVSPYVKKKMGGGMMNKPMGYDQGAPKGGIDVKKQTGTPSLQAVKKQAGRPFPKKNKKFDAYIIIDGKTQKLPNYRTGQMVMARGCKLGRKKATKIT